MEVDLTKYTLKVFWYKEYDGITQEAAWKAISDLNTWHKWNEDIFSVVLNGVFKEGTTFKVATNRGINFTSKIVRIDPGQSFTDHVKVNWLDCTGTQKVEKMNNGVRISYTYALKPGPIRYLYYFYMWLVLPGIMEKKYNHLVAKLRGGNQ